MYKGIANKAESFDLYVSGKFGNKLRTWDTYHDLCMSNYHGTVTMRYVETDSKWCKYRVAREDINDVLADWRDQGASMIKVRFNESAPDDKLLIQGEIQEHPEHKYVLSYSHEQVPMREAMRNPESMLGREALWLLEGHLSKASMRNLKHIFATYPRAIVEFSCYDHMLGDIPDNNTIFWEVRNY